MCMWSGSCHSVSFSDYPCGGSDHLPFSLCHVWVVSGCSLFEVMSSLAAVWCFLLKCANEIIHYYYYVPNIINVQAPTNIVFFLMVHSKQLLLTTNNKGGVVTI